MPDNTKSGCIEQVFTFEPAPGGLLAPTPALPPDAPVYHGVSGDRIDEWSADGPPLETPTGLKASLTSRPTSKLDHMRPARRTAH